MNKIYILAPMLSSVVITGCGGGGSSSTTNPVDPSPVVIDENTPESIPTALRQTHASCYPPGTGVFSVGVLDNGFNPNHSGFSGSADLVFHDYDQILSDIDSGDISLFAEEENWAQHGTHVAGLASSGELNTLSSETYTAPTTMVINYNIIDAIYEPSKLLEVFNGTYIDAQRAELASGECVSPYYRTNDCYGVNAYLVKEYPSESLYPIAVHNMSYEFYDFANFLNFDLDYYSYVYPNEPDATHDQSRELGLASGSPSYVGRNTLDYQALRGVLSTDSVMIVAAGNSSSSLTELTDTDTYLQFSETFPGDMVNVFYDEDSDSNSDGVIEINEQGLTRNFLVVGSYNNDNFDLSSFSNFPGSDESIQKRFILAPGESLSSYDFSSDYGYLSMTGTSMAAPQVSYLVNLLKSEFSNIPTDVILNSSLSNANKNFSGYSPELHGQGIFDYEATRAHLSTLICD